MIQFFHKLLNPHCEHCTEQRREERRCESCDTLRSQLELANHDKKKLLELIERMNNPSIPEPVEPLTDIKPIIGGNAHWPTLKRTLEAEDRKEAELLKKARSHIGRSDNIKDLEREVGIPESQERKNAIS